MHLLSVAFVLLVLLIPLRSDSDRILLVLVAAISIVVLCSFS